MFQDMNCGTLIIFTACRREHIIANVRNGNRRDVLGLQ
jgi:hypothetical protein